MKIIRVFPRRTSMTPQDDYAFIGDPPMLRPEADEVHISCTFTWDREEAARLASAWAQYYPYRLGGCSFGSTAGSFTPGMYVRSGVTVTSRGCNNRCPWCLVPHREGRIRELDIHPGNNVIDNNLLQCSGAHLAKVFDMLRTQHGTKLSGGLDSRLLTDSIADDLCSLRINELFFACDYKEALRPLEKARRKLQGFSIHQLRCYVMVAYGGQTQSEALEILEAVYELGFMPFAQLYQPPEEYIDYSKSWRKLAKQWLRPAITKAIHRHR